MDGPGLRVNNLAMGYGSIRVLDRVTLPVLPAGSLTALVGPNAAGKSTLLRGLAGLQAARGQIALDGRDLARQPMLERSRHIVYLPQTLPARSRLGVFESVLSAAMAGRPSRRPWGRQADAGTLRSVEDVLARLGLAPLADRLVETLSGGQRQLVGLAQALVRQPRVLLLDEPTSALDLRHQCRVLETVARETRERRLVTIAALHDINLALDYADLTLVLHEGRLASAGPPACVIDSALLARVYGVRGSVETVRGRPVVLVDGPVDQDRG